MTLYAKKSFVIRNISMLLIGVNIFIFLLQSFIPDFTNLFVLKSAEVLIHPWTLLTTMFLHGSFTHLLFNMYALLLFGPLVERRIGSKRFLILYFIAGLLASIAATYYPSALGASGAIMSVLGMVIVLFPRMKVLFFFVIPMSMRTAGIVFALLDIFGFAFGGTGVAHLAHLAGLAFGLAYGFYLVNKHKTFTAKFTTPKSFNLNQKAPSKKRKDYEQTIELSKDEIDEYFKYGRIK